MPILASGWGCPTPVRPVLVITAHPDDVDFGCGGTVATWTRDGIDVSYCVITDGDAVSAAEVPREMHYLG